MTIVQMTSKFNKYNVGERISLADHVAKQWCGESNPRFQVAVRLPDEESVAYFQAAELKARLKNLTNEDAAKILQEPPQDKMLKGSMTKDNEPSRGPGRPRNEN